MTIEELIAQIRASMQTLLTERGTHTSTIQNVRSACASGDNRNPTDAEAEQVRSAQAEVERIDADITAATARIDQLQAEQQSNERASTLARSLAAAGAPAGAGGTSERRPAGGAHVTSEERTYTRRKDLRGEASFFADSFRAQSLGDVAARQRLERHSVEVEREGEMSERAVATGGFGGLIVPQYLVNLAARVLRYGRPVANMCTHLELPAQGMNVVIPRGTTGAAAASQATENTALQNTDEVWANLQPPVVTIGGQQDVSRQSLERGTPGIDEIVYLDLAGAYHSELDRQVVNGSGASNQMLGILNTSGINAATAYGAVITPALFNTKIAGQIAAIAGAGSSVMPRFIAMNPRRWGWLTSLVDGQGRPLLPAQSGGPMNAMGVVTAPGAYGGDGDPIDRETFVTSGVIQGLPVVTDGNIPTNVGTNAEDVAIVLDPAHALLWEDGDGMPRQLRFDQTLGGSLTVKLVAYGYAAFTAGRYPVAFGKTGGVDATATFGQVAPTF